ncbi:MAG: hypothetical protein B7X06_01405 [Verrucomicrobia bacterium 21-51-4]|nr:MAG: hypothetical protein B7X06_01405 [Verrucomicrobia bacterium 21-51-4]
MENSLLRFATFVAFFPQLVAGPIVRADAFLPQLHQDHAFNWDRWVNGFSKVLWGFFLKCAVADSLAPFVDGLYSNPTFFSSISWMIGSVFYSFQIYGDFAGYSLIAIGLAHMLGYDFNTNFDRPYFSANFSEFWHRWHISLSSWLRDYLYIPLGGNRQGSARTYANLMITMLLGGLWHGANWTFVVWGLLQGSYLCLQRALAPLWDALARVIGAKTLRCIGIVCVFSLVTLTWVFFRAQSLAEALFILERMLSFSSMTLSSIPTKFVVVKGLALISFLALSEALSLLIDFKQTATSYPWLRMAWSALTVCALALFGTFGSSAFIYFQF